MAGDRRVWDPLMPAPLRRGTKSLPRCDVVVSVRRILDSLNGITSLFDQLQRNLPETVDKSTIDQWISEFQEQRDRLSQFITILKKGYRR